MYLTIELLTITLAALVGAAVGSFVAAAGLRVTTNKSIISTPSSCDSCETRLRVLDLIPVLSYALNLGKCRYCGHALTPLYLGTEVAFTVVAICVALFADLSWSSFLILGAIILLGICAVSDLKAMLLPLPAMLCIGCLGVIYQFISEGSSGLIDAFVGISAGVMVIAIPGLLYWLIRKAHGFGEGDYWLMGAIGSWMTWIEPIVIFYSATILCLFATIIEALCRGKSLQALDQKPIGAFLSGLSVIYLSAKLCTLEAYFEVMW